jgi:hypothetical protein
LTSYTTPWALTRREPSGDSTARAAVFCFDIDSVPTAPDAKRTPWPIAVNSARSDQKRVGIVVANFNTRRLIAQLVFSLYRLLGRNEFAQIVVVDNGSTDGSTELLKALHARN